MASTRNLLALGQNRPNSLTYVANASTMPEELWSSRTPMSHHCLALFQVRVTRLYPLYHSYCD